MNPVFHLTPTPEGLFIGLAAGLASHLDRAGVSYCIEASPGAMARFAAGAVLKSRGMDFVPETRGEQLDRANRLGLLLSGSGPLTKEDAAILALRVLELLEEGGSAG